MSAPAATPGSLSLNDVGVSTTTGSDTKIFRRVEHFIRHDHLLKPRYSIYPHSTFTISDEVPDTYLIHQPYGK